MSAQPAAAGGKVCVVCGTDVSRKPRVKDQQGRYMCEGACEQTAKERAHAAMARQTTARPASPKPPAPPPKSDDYDMMADLLNDSPAVNVQACPGCGSAMQGGALVCMSCGYNARVGKAAKTKVIKTPVASQMPVPRRRASGEFGPSFGVLFLVSTGLLCGLAALGAVAPPAVGIALLLSVVVANIGYIWSMVAAFRAGETKLGIYAFIPLLNIIFLFWACLTNTDKWSRSLLLSGWLSFAVSMIVIFAKYGDIEGLTKTMGP